MVGKGIVNVSKALSYHQIDIQKSNDTKPEVLKDQMWKANIILDALEMLAEKTTKFPVNIIENVMQE